MIGSSHSVMDIAGNLAEHLRRFITADSDPDAPPDFISAMIADQSLFWAYFNARLAARKFEGAALASCGVEGAMLLTLIGRGGLLNEAYGTYGTESWQPGFWRGAVPDEAPIVIVHLVRGFHIRRLRRALGRAGKNVVSEVYVWPDVDQNSDFDRETTGDRGTEGRAEHAAEPEEASKGGEGPEGGEAASGPKGGEGPKGGFVAEGTENDPERHR